MARYRGSGTRLWGAKNGVSSDGAERRLFQLSVLVGSEMAAEDAATTCTMEPVSGGGGQTAQDAVFR